MTWVLEMLYNYFYKPWVLFRLYSSVEKSIDSGKHQLVKQGCFAHTLFAEIIIIYATQIMRDIRLPNVRHCASYESLNMWPVKQIFTGHEKP